MTRLLQAQTDVQAKVQSLPALPIFTGEVSQTMGSTSGLSYFMKEPSLLVGLRVTSCTT